MKYLKNSSEIHKKLSELFFGDESKWAIVAFVGANPMSLLPKKIKNLEVICWPLAGGTNPKGIRKLIDAGVKVRFCKGLHSKIYIREGVGVIVGSANLSQRALKGNDQHEFAIYSNDTKFDLHGLLKSLPRISPVTKANLQKLQTEHDLFLRRNPRPGKVKSQSATFLDAATTSFPREWKLVSCYGELKKADMEAVENDLTTNFGSSSWNNYNCAESGTFSIGDYVLQLATNTIGQIVRQNAKWIFVDHIVQLAHTDVIVQTKNLDLSECPFILDNKFKKAIKREFNDFTQAEVAEGELFSSDEFMNALKKRYQAENG